jgi:hypothetical protein
MYIKDRETGFSTRYTEEEFIAERDRLLALHETAKQELEAAKEKEMILRKKCVDFAFDQDKKSGTENIALANGYKAKAVKKLTYGFVQNDEGLVDKDAIEKALVKIEQDGTAGKMIAERLIKWTPSLSLTEYKQLTPAHKQAIDEVIVTKEGAPTLTIVPPKAK